MHTDRSNLKLEEHYVVKEDGRIRACVGAYTQKIHVGGETLLTRNIGGVSVHKDANRRGYMRKLMAMALEDMKADGVDASLLGGLRHRYQYFGYEKLGHQFSAHVTTTNIRHFLGEGFDSPYMIRPLCRDDEAAMAAVRALHDAQAIHGEREAFYDTLCSWKSTPYIVLRDGEICGYFCVAPNKDRFTELVLQQPEEIAPVLAAWFRESGTQSIGIGVEAHEQTLLHAVYKLCEGYQMGSPEQCRVFRFERTVRAFLQLKATYAPLADGELTLAIDIGERIRIAVENGKPVVEALAADAPCMLSLTEMEAQSLLFAPVGFLTTLQPIPDAVRTWLPLPIGIANADSV